MIRWYYDNFGTNLYIMHNYNNLFIIFKMHIFKEISKETIIL